MRVCDRCKKSLDTNKRSSLAGEVFDLCLACARYIANHIKTYNPKGGILTGLARAFK